MKTRFSPRYFVSYLGTCSLHPVLKSFRQEITSFSFYLGQSFTDIDFFFKLSSAGREDHRSLHSLMETLDKFVIWKQGGCQ